MNITRNTIDPLHAELVVEVSPADYEERVNEGLKKVQRQAVMPGFRQGKVPAGIIKKQYGGQVMADELNKLLNDSIFKYIEDNNLNILGQPLPKTEEQVDPANGRDFRFVYELGLSPEFDLRLDHNIEIEYQTVRVDDDLIDKYVKDVRRRYSESSHPEVSEEGDYLFVDLVELDQSGAIKPAGIFKSTTISLERVSDKARKALSGLKVGDKVVVNVDDVFTSAGEKAASLAVSQEEAANISCDLQITVKSISRMQEAELNQGLFDKVYGPGKVDSEQAFRDHIRGELQAMFRADSERKFRKAAEDKLVSSLDLALPDSFLKRWIMASNEKPITSEQIEREYPEYAKALKWQLIENRIIADNHIQVTEAEAKEEAKAYISSEYARYGQTPAEEDLERISKDLLNNKKEAQKVYTSLYSRKVAALLKEKCTVQEREVSSEEFFGR